MAQKLPKMAQNYPQIAQIWRPDLRTFSASFFYWKSGSANFFAFRMYDYSVDAFIKILIIIIWCEPPLDSPIEPT